MRSATLAEIISNTPGAMTSSPFLILARSWARRSLPLMVDMPW